MESLISKLNQHKASVSVIGLGYVGLPLACALSEVGFSVTGIDLDNTKVCNLNKGISHIPDIPNSKISELIGGKTNHNGLLIATDKFDGISDSDVIIICVPTPLRKTKEPDITFVVSAATEISNFITPDTLVVLESTTYPGTTKDILYQQIHTKNPELKIGENIFIAFSPERIDPGRTDFTIKNTPKVVGGITKYCTKVAESLYMQVTEKVVPVSNPEIAEMVKLLENTFRLTNIALVNELAIMCEQIGVDVWEVIDAASTKPFGFMPFYPGPGLGGHCIPIDPHYLAWKMETVNYKARFIELAAQINHEMPEYVVSKITAALNSMGKALSTSKTMILGVSYKADINDTRESPALDIIQLLKNQSTIVEYNDPHVPEIKLVDETLYSKSIERGSLSKYDCTIISTNHRDYDWGEIVKDSQLIIDTRNATKGIHSNKIIKL
tara:strand:+ start:334 stop:1653 length:1320 start_codon:yes stop_codon:yes gene_type:complete